MRLGGNRVSHVLTCLGEPLFDKRFWRVQDKPLAEVLEDAAARPEAENTAEKSEEE